MMFKSKLAGFIGVLSIIGSSFALGANPKTCPSMTSLQREGMTMYAEITYKMYITYNTSYYDTPSNWIFIMGPITGSTGEAAVVQSNDILSTLSGTPSPEEDSDEVWTCNYNTAGHSELSAFAIQADDMISPLKMAGYLKRIH